MDISHIANLARIELSDQEVARFDSQLSQVLEHAAKLKELDVSGIEPMAHAYPIFDVVREDVAGDESFSAQQALSNAPAQAQGQFKVPKVMD
ncbi:MAG: Asp-tRNA(Asn)/Glu-tRNA(Gln) amidotransferase subunit GatC [Verrucomicrobiales bacterium]|nr:Asp-tRNA(Asn)/Glu-tRNA(Gln) amidotransferase subunit GatC [Verrucomicrobiales bacterium]